MTQSAIGERRALVERLLNPESIALVGMSPSGGYAGSVHMNLQRFGFPGRVYAVNPKYEEVLGTPCFPNIEAIPEHVDCAIVAVAAQSVLGVLEECAGAGVGSAVVMASGFAEAHQRGSDLQRRLTELTRESGLAVCGPNCLGFINLPGNVVGFSVLPPELRQGGVGLISQSGGLSSDIMISLLERNVGVSYLISSGNEAGLTTEDYLEYLLGQPDARVIGLVVESFRQPKRLLELLDLAADQRKPIVALKVGRSEQGRRQTASHTGALASDDRVVDAIFRDFGVTRVTNVGDLLETLTCFAVNRTPIRPKAAFVSGSGGLAAILADLAADSQVELAQLSDATASTIAEVLPDFATVSNPLDVTGPTYQSNETYAHVLNILAVDPDVGVLCVYQNASHVDAPTPKQAGRNLRLTKVLEDVSRECGVPIVAFTNGGSGIIDPAIPPILHDAGVPLLYGADRAVRAIGSAVRYAAFVASRANESRSTAIADIDGAVTEILDRLSPGSGLCEYWSKQLLAGFGLPVPPGGLARDVDEAIEIAARVGYPVVIKAASPGIVHKSAAGLVALNVRDGDELIAAFKRLSERAREVLGSAGASLEGMLVEKMMPGGVEVLIGARASEFGPIVLFGAGGVLTEIAADTAICLAPVTVTGAEEMIASTRVGQLLLQGPDYASAVRDLGSVLVRISELAASAEGTIQELDVNPVIVSPAGIVLADAVIRG